MGVPLHTRKNPGASPLFTPEDFCFKTLKNAAGAHEMATTAQEWLYTVGEGRILRLARVIVHLSDSSVDISDFGGIAGGLTNGCLLAIHDSNNDVLLDPLDGSVIKTNGDWAHLAATDVRVDNGQGDDQLTVRWTIHKAGEIMSLLEGQHLSFTTQDNLTALSSMHIVLQGIEYDIP